jgi:holo-[acyl-carrier protein] synthase
MSDFKKYIETIRKEEFITFLDSHKPEEIFSERELKLFIIPQNMKSLAGRYLIKKTIADFINNHEKMKEIEIINNNLGKPEVFLGENIRRIVEFAKIKSIQCSISHSRNFISGMTILCFE